jgi:hypothetical protein
MSNSTIPEQLNSVATIIGELGNNIAEAQKRLDAAYVQSLSQVLGSISELINTSEKKAEVTKAQKDLAQARQGTDEAKIRAAQTALDQALASAIPSGVLELIKAIGPSRYQYSETTLKVRIDLSRSLDVTGSLGVGAGFGAVTVNAALTVGYAYDYQAAAECTTVLHAVPTNETVLVALLNRAKEIGAQPLALPARSAADDKLIEQLKTLSAALAPKSAT